MPGVQYRDRVIEAQSYKSDSGRWRPQALVSIHEGGTHLVPAPSGWRRGGSTTRAPRPYARGVPGPNGYCSGCSRGDAYLAAAGASNPSRALRRASKRSETAGGIVDLVTDPIRASGFCGMRFGQVRAWATTDSLRSAPQSRQR